MNNKTRKLVFSSLIGAIYAVLTIILAPLSYGPIQIRIAEALTILPFFASFPIYGLFIGCILANYVGYASGLSYLGSFGMIDVVFGSLATLTAAYATYLIGKNKSKLSKFFAPLPPVIVNAVVVALEIKYTASIPSEISLPLTMITVGLGELIACYVLGLPLLQFIQRNKKIKDYLQ